MPRQRWARQGRGTGLPIRPQVNLSGRPSACPSVHAIEHARHVVFTRGLGEATVHGDDIMHGVSAMRAGVRYSLILFFYALQDIPSSLEYQTVPKSQLRRSADERVARPTAERDVAASGDG